MTRQVKAPLTQAQRNQRANAMNKNKATLGENEEIAKVHGNRADQESPNISWYVCVNLINLVG